MAAGFQVLGISIPPVDAAPYGSLLGLGAAIGVGSIERAGAAVTLGAAGTISIDPVTGQNLTLNTLGAGVIDLLSASTFSIDGTGNSNVSVTSGDLTLSTITAGDLLGSAAVAVTITANGGDATFQTLGDSSGDVYIICGKSTKELYFNARGGGNIPFNEAAPDNALVGFAATSVIGALNEVRAAVTAEDLWDRAGVVLSPHTASDSISVSVADNSNHIVAEFIQNDVTNAVNCVEASSAYVHASAAAWLASLKGSAIEAAQTGAGLTPAIHVSYDGAGLPIMFSGTGVQLGTGTINQSNNVFAIAFTTQAATIEAALEAKAVSAVPGTVSADGLEARVLAIRDINAGGNARAILKSKIDHASAGGNVITDVIAETIGTGNSTVYITASATGVGTAHIDVDSDTMGIDLTSTLNIQSVGASLWGNDSGDLQLQTSTTGDLRLLSADELFMSAGANMDVDVTGTFDLLASSTLSIDATGDSNLTIDTGSLTLATTTSGTLLVDGVALVDINAGANMDVDVTGTFTMDSSGAFSIDGADPSNVSVTNYDLTLSTITAGDIYITSAADVYATATTFDLTGALTVSGLITGNGGVTTTGVGTLSFGADASAQSINLGTGAAAKTIIIGSVTAGSTTQLLSETYVRVGTGSPGVALGAGGFYVTGKMEVDSTAYFDGYLNANLGVTMSSGASIGGALGNTVGSIKITSTHQTNDASLLLTGTDSETWIMCQVGDVLVDFGGPAETNPTFRIQSADATTVSQYLKFNHNQTNAVITCGAGAIQLNAATFVMVGTGVPGVHNGAGDLYVQNGIESGGGLDVTGTTTFRSDTAHENVKLASNKVLYGGAGATKGSITPYNAAQNLDHLTFNTGTDAMLISVFAEANKGVSYDALQQTDPTIQIYSTTAAGTSKTEHNRLAWNNLSIGGASGSFFGLKSVTEEVTIAVGQGAAGVATAANLAPAGSLIVGATARVTDAPGGGATTVDIGVTGGDADAFVDGMSTALNTTADTATDGNAGAQMPIANGAATTLTLTTDVNVAGDDMKVRVVVYYLQFTVPTS